MRKITWIFLIAITSVVAAQEAEVENLHFIPPDYYVGDYVELYFTLSMDKFHLLESPSLLPESDWIDIKDINIEQDGLKARVKISFVSFYPGTRTLMPISLGDVSIREIKLFTRSMKDEGFTELAPLAPQIDLPATRLVLALIIISFLIIPFVLYFLIYFMTGMIKISLVRYRERAPYRTLMRLLKKLSFADHTLDNKEFYLKLTEGIRIYLSKRFERDYITATTKEMLSPPESSISRKLWESLIKILNKGDLVKFAGDKASYTEKQNSLVAMESIARSLEEKR